MMNIRLEIEGLEEKETQERVRKQLEGMEGVWDVCMSREEKCVDVSYDDRTSDAEIHNHLQNNGYKIY